MTTGDIGYIATGFKSVEFCRVGDTITNSRMYANDQQMKTNLIKPLPGYKKVTPMVYASFYPIEGDDYNFMRDALDKLKLNDAAFEFEPESSQALGRGFRCGFLGMLHLEIIQSRLEREFDISPTITTPSVVYEVELKGKKEKVKIYSATEMPDPSVVEKIYEPYAKLDIISPAQNLGSIMEVMNNTQAQYSNTEYIDSERIVLTFDCPLTDVITNLHDDLKAESPLAFLLARSEMQLAENVIKSSADKTGLSHNGSSHFELNPVASIWAVGTDRIAADIKGGF